MPRRRRDRIDGVVDRNLENGVVGLIVSRPGAYELFVAHGLELKFFHQVECQRVFSAAVRLSATGEPVEILAIASELHRLGYSDEITPARLAALDDGVVWPVDAEERRRSVRAKVARLTQLWIDRTTLGDLEKLDDAFTAPTLDREWIQDRIEQMSERLGDTIEEDDGTPATAFQAVLRDVARGERGAVLGLDAFDDHLGGIRSGQVCLMLARGGVAKTLMLCRSAVDTMAQGWGCVFFSLEMSLSAIFERFYRIASGLDQWTYERAKFSGALDVDVWARACERLVLHERLYGVSEMERRIIRAQHDRLRAVPGTLICVDYLQLIPGNESQTSYERMSKIAKDLKKLAKRREVAVLIAVQVSREAGGDGSRRLTLGAARDSGQIEEACDIAVGLRRLDQSHAIAQDVRLRYNSRIFVDLLKRRGGPLFAHGDEIAYEVNWNGFRLTEDLNLKPPQPKDDDDPLAVAQRRRGR